MLKGRRCVETAGDTEYDRRPRVFEEFISIYYLFLKIFSLDDNCIIKTVKKNQDFGMVLIKRIHSITKE